jgi:uncharacterized membrane protein
MQLLKIAATCGVVFAILDGIWLGFVMNGFYRSQLAPIVRLSADGGIAPNWPAAFLVYVVLGIGIAWFVMPNATTAASAAGYGALFGFCVYGVYDLTNFSTLAQYPLPIAIVDTAWGTFATAICASVVRAIYGWHA